MEDFTQNPQRFDNLGGQAPVREKNMYLLHLDTTRIIILSAILVAVVAVSFLLGMNFTGNDDKKSDIVSNDIVLEQPGDIQPENPVASLDVNDTDPLKDHLSDSASTLSTDDILNPKPESTRASQTTTSKSSSGNATETRTASNTRPASGTTRQSSTTARTTNQTRRTSTASNTTTRPRQPETRAASGRVTPAPATTAASTSRSGYIVQVASLDTSSKAQTAINELKDMRLNGYIDRTSVNSKSYYRVRIGPFASRQQALDLMNRMQNSTRFKEAYVIQQ